MIYDLFDLFQHQQHGLSNMKIWSHLTIWLWVIQQQFIAVTLPLDSVREGFGFWLTGKLGRAWVGTWVGGWVSAWVYGVVMW